MKRIALLAVALILVSGCLFIPQEDKYAIFSYLPSEGANGSVFIDLKEPAFAEISSLLGTLQSGKIKDIKGMQAAVVTYDDKSSAGIIQMKTALNIDDLVGGLPQYYLGIGSATTEFVNESKVIGNRNVTLLYTKYDTAKKNPICTWREGDWLNVLYYQKAYSSSYSQCTFPAGFSCVSYTLNQSGELYLKVGQGTGHEIKINSILCNASGDYYGVPNVNAPLKNSITLTSGSLADLAGGSSDNTVVCSGIGGGYFSGKIYMNYTEIDTGLQRVAVGSLSLSVGGSAEKEKRCDTILENKYDTARAKELLQESAEIGSSIVTSGSVFGNGMIHAENQSTYVAVFGDDVGDYGVWVARGGETGSNLCYSDTYGTAKAEVVKRGNKEACVMSGGSTAYSLYSLFGSQKQFLNIQRKVGEYSITLVAFAKDSKEKVKSNAEDIIFGINLPGDEVKWTDKMNLHVKVYETFEGGFDRQPVADAKVELYNESYAYSVYDSYGARKQEPLKTVYTDDNGVADFNNLDVGRYTLSASKPGYSKGTGYVYPGGSMNVSIMLESVKPIRVTVRESGVYSDGMRYGTSAIAGATVELYNGSSILADSGDGGYYENYKLIKTLYTDSNGVADFGKTDIDRGKVEVSKEGYFDSTSYLSSYNRNLTVYLSKSDYKYNYTYGKNILKVYVSESGSSSEYPVVNNARIELYGKSGGKYALIKALYSNSSGIADFGEVNISEGKIEAGKEGYYNSTEMITPLNAPRFATTFVVDLVKAVSNATADYPVVQVGGSGCINPNKQGAPPEWVIGSPDGKGACFWESSPIFGRFDNNLTFSKLNLTVSANSVSVNKPLEVLTSKDSNCYYKALGYDFSSYTHYATFTPDASDKFKGYVVSNGTVSAMCIAVKDITRDGYGEYIDSIRVY
ncbi:carboxypeptidase regulatory-like domain-containing protein [Candidatus Micrarchaeota archaeon]|nr:carboxypeptidase regulatory-like domain-containing protein [Candidatus Micrarchaeota archaeon]